MDIRVARTERAIEKACMELRAKNPLEKSKIKDLCALACINKSTFYAHYEDIYALSSGLETKVIGNILACVTDFGPNRPLDHTEELTQGLFRAFVQNQRAVNILFSGSRQGVFANSIEQGLRKRVAELDPTFTADPRRGIVLSFCVQGCFYAFTNNSGRMDEAKLVAAGRKALVGIVLTQQPPVFRAGSHHPVGVGTSLGHQVVDQGPDIAARPVQDDLLPA